jgi:SAM-dependent methyltransferase
MSVERDYVLGTDEAEIARLGLQHLVWRPRMLAAWRRAGITRGSRVLDIGAGPGYATTDLAEIVGPEGETLALERSARFAAAARRRCREQGLTNSRVEEVDLMEDPIAATGFDAAWCRWVACFVSSPERLVARIASALKSGGVAIFHEYADYASWRLLPGRPLVEQFVAEVMANWRASGGEPDSGRTLPALLSQGGFVVREIRPIVFAVRPSDFIWQWPAAFLRSGVRRLAASGRVDSSFADAVTAEWDRAELDASTVMITPMVLEIIAEVSSGVVRPSSRASSGSPDGPRCRSDTH